MSKYACLRSITTRAHDSTVSWRRGSRSDHICSMRQRAVARLVQVLEFNPLWMHCFEFNVSLADASIFVFISEFAGPKRQNSAI